MEEYYVLNPDYMIRNDLNKIILYSKAQVAEYSSPEWFSCIHPAQAMILSFFTYERTLSENIAEIVCCLNIGKEKVVNFLNHCIGNAVPFFVSWQGHKINFPANLLIHRDRIKNGYTPLQLTVREMDCNRLDLDDPRIHTLPLQLTFMLTNRCVCQCVYCYADIHRYVARELPAEQLVDIIQQSAGLGVQNIHLAGGEIFLFERWDQVLAALCGSDYMPGLLSTKYPLTRQLIKRLAKTGYRNRIQVSLDTVSADIAKRQQRVGERYIQQLMEGIRLLDHSDIKYTVSTVLTRLNCSVENVHMLFSFLRTLKHITRWDIRVAMDSLYVDKKKQPQIKAAKETIEQVYTYLEDVIVPDADFDICLKRSVLKDNLYTAGGNTDFSKGRCTALNSHMFILPDGQVTICEQLYWNPHFIIGDIKTQTITEIWNSDRATFLLNMQPANICEESACRKCSFFAGCFGRNKRCWSDVIKAYGSDNWDYPDPHCSRAPRICHSFNYYQ